MKAFFEIPLLQQVQNTKKKKVSPKKKKLEVGLERWFSHSEHFCSLEDPSSYIRWIITPVSLGTCTHMPMPICKHTHLKDNKVTIFTWIYFLRSGGEGLLGTVYIWRREVPFGGWFFPSTTWIAGIKLRPLDLAASTLTHLAILLA